MRKHPFSDVRNEGSFDHTAVQHCVHIKGWGKNKSVRINEKK